MGKTAPAEDLSAKKALALTVIDRLKNEYPDAGCTLDYDHAWQLLVSVRLAAQCTDARVNIVVQELFAKYPDVAALAAAEPEDIEAIVKPCGLGRSKARDISACMRVLRDKYDCKVSGCAIKSALWTASRSRRRWRGRCGRSSLPKRAATCATASSCTAGLSATPADPNVKTAA